MTAGVPLLLAGLGEQISEKAGVLNIGIEGMMLFGAYTGFVAAYLHRLLLISASSPAGWAAWRSRFSSCCFCIRFGIEPDRHRHRAHHGRRGADGAAALLPVQPHLSAPLGRRRWSHCRCWTRSRCSGRALFSHNIVVYLAVAPGVRPRLALPADLYRAQPGGGGQQAGRAGRRRRRRHRGPARSRCWRPASWPGSAAPIWPMWAPGSSSPS